MKKRRYIFLSIVFIYLAWVGTSCISEPEFPFRPSITFDAVDVIRVTDQLGNIADSVSISILFEDGDGDLGALPGDTTDNYFVNLLQLRNGQFVRFNVPDSTLDFNGTFPDLNAEGVGAIKGTLLYSFPSIRLSTYRLLNIPANDIWKFEIYIKDRAGNFSDTIQTDSVVVNIQ